MHKKSQVNPWRIDWVMAILLLLPKYVVFSCLANSCEKDNKVVVVDTSLDVSRWWCQVVVVDMSLDMSRWWWWWCQSVCRRWLSTCRWTCRDGGDGIMEVVVVDTCRDGVCGRWHVQWRVEMVVGSGVEVPSSVNIGGVCVDQVVVVPGAVVPLSSSLIK